MQSMLLLINNDRATIANIMSCGFENGGGHTSVLLDMAAQQDGNLDASPPPIEPGPTTAYFDVAEFKGYDCYAEINDRQNKTKRNSNQG
ncbi:hypothetical protein GFC08_02535 [Roseibium aggregatum]|nr:hypothetical protein GFC08_02535 [Roseibium aggregatum]